MSAGSPICPIRIPAALLAEIERVIENANERRKGEPWTRTAFILTAIREKVAKMERSRTWHKKQLAGDVAGDQ